MEKCANCSAGVIAGQGCISCGHLNGGGAPAASQAPAFEETPQSDQAEQPLSPFADLMEGSNKSGDLMGKLKGSKVAPILAGLGVLLVLGVAAVTMFGGKAETDVVPDEFAAAPVATTPPTGAEVGTQFCVAPGPVADAPEPDPANINTFASFYKFGTTEWKPLKSGAYTPEYINARAESTDLSTISDTADPAYIACITGIANDIDKTCRIYEDAARHIISGADYTLAVYQLSTGEKVAEGPVRNGTATCPAVVVGNVSYSEFLPRQHDLAMWTAEFAVPNQFTNVHLDRAALGGSPEWCLSPSVIDTGTTATSSTSSASSTGIHLLIQEDAGFTPGEVNWTTAKMTELSHIACVRFAPTGEEHSCDYQGGNKLVRPEGLFEVRVVDIATGEQVANNMFDSVEGCSAIVIFNRDGETKREDALPERALYEWLNEQNPTPPEPEAEEGTLEEENE